MREPISGHDDACIELPLDGIVVLDFSQFLAGPSCSLRLADLGARVVKIERPHGGDACRQLRIAGQAVGGDSVLFHTINRNKESVAADLKAPGELALVKRLIASADVMIHNFRPGVMERIGLGWDQVRALNPRIVYAKVTGYGDEGPWRDKPGQDLLVQSLSGLAWLNGNRDDPPTPIGAPAIDMLTGAHLVQGVLAALVRRARTGRGGRIEASLMESALDLQFELTTAYLQGAGTPRRSGVSNAGAFSAAPYGIYATADGFIAVAMTPVDGLGRLIGCEALTAFDDKAVWYSDRDGIKAILRDHFPTNPTAHWLAILEPADIWCAEVLDYPRLMASEGFAAVDMVQETRTSGGDVVRTTRCPIRVDGQKLFSRRGAPRLGEDTDAVMREFAADRATAGAES